MRKEKEQETENRTGRRNKAPTGKRKGEKGKREVADDKAIVNIAATTTTKKARTHDSA